jgi:hypothetical protein
MPVEPQMWSRKSEDPTANGCINRCDHPPITRCRILRAKLTLSETAA